MTDLDNFYSAGYFLIRANTPDWPDFRADLLPEKLISLSTCICPRVEVTWGWLPGNPEMALEFGIPQEQLDAFLEWCKREYETSMDYVSMFYSPEAVREFIARFLPETTGLYLIGVGLHQDSDVASRHVHGEGEPPTGIEVRLGQHLPMELGGDMLGFEVVSFAYHDFGHSWLCSGLHKDMHALYGIRPNAYGLIDSEDDARKVSDWIAEDEMKGTRAEPEPYDYWLLVSYPLTR
jgi:hypothetical protein